MSHLVLRDPVGVPPHLHVRSEPVAVVAWRDGEVWELRAEQLPDLLFEGRHVGGESGIGRLESRGMRREEVRDVEEVLEAVGLASRIGGTLGVGGRGEGIGVLGTGSRGRGKEVSAIEDVLRAGELGGVERSRRIWEALRAGVLGGENGDRREREGGLGADEILMRSLHGRLKGGGQEARRLYIRRSSGRGGGQGRW